MQAPQSVAVFDIAGARVERDDEFLEVELTSGEDLQLRALSLGAARGAADSLGIRCVAAHMPP